LPLELTLDNLLLKAGWERADDTCSGHGEFGDRAAQDERAPRWQADGIGPSVRRVIPEDET
jgi:hypothetical protein